MTKNYHNLTRRQVLDKLLLIESKATFEELCLLLIKRERRGWLTR
jgi:hypothetical protein